MDLRPSDLAAAVRSLTDPAAALKTLHWGRNYLYLARLETAAGPVEVVVKQLRHRNLLRKRNRLLFPSAFLRNQRSRIPLRSSRFVAGAR